MAARHALKALVALSAVAIPLGIAGPAHATVTSSGCTVTPLAPVFKNQWTSTGDKRIQYPVEVSCSAGRSITITDERWEADTTSADDFIGSSTLVNSFGSTGGTLTRTITATLPDSDPWGDDNEEMYHRVRFTVSSNGVTSPVTVWDMSPTRTFHL